jgi:thioredoxin
MKHLTALVLVIIFAGSIYAQDGKSIKPEHLTVATFKEKVFNYEKNPDKWTFEGDLPCIVDFYADWCKPCKLIAPIMEELATEYKGKINVYKVNTEQQRELSSVFGIRSIPAVLFIPMEGQPQMSTGALPKESFKQAIDEFLLGQKKDQ